MINKGYIRIKNNKKVLFYSIDKKLHSIKNTFVVKFSDSL